MSNSKEYEIKARSQEVELFLARLVAHIEKSGYEERVHLHEPRQQEEILEYTREEAILSIEVDRQSLGECVFKISSSTIDPDTIVLEVLSDLCADLVATFVRPIAGKVNIKDLDDLFNRQIGEYIKRNKS